MYKFFFGPNSSLFISGNGSDFTQTLGSNIWDYYIIHWNLITCRCSKRSI